MPATIEYPGYRKIDTPSVLRGSSRQYADEIGEAVVPSSYEIPESIQFRAHNGGMEATFTYSDDEAEEPSERTLLERPLLAITVARESKRILRLRAQDAQAFLVTSGGQIPFIELVAAGQDLPPRQRRMLIRSAVVTSVILASVPEQIKRSVIETSSEPRHFQGTPR
jgi:hypothetical protein